MSSSISAEEIKIKRKTDHAIVSHRKSYRRTVDFNDSEQKSLAQSRQTMTKIKFTPDKFIPQISLVDQLKSGSSNHISKKSIGERKTGYRRYKSGGLECFNQEELKCQEGIVIDLMKSAGKVLMEGKNVVGISLPVRIFEPRSTIERVCDWWAFGPIYLTRAAKIKVFLFFS